MSYRTVLTRSTSRNWRTMKICPTWCTLKPASAFISYMPKLDQPVDADDPDTLAGVLKKTWSLDPRHDGRQTPEFGGPHAFNTLGSAGGQTVVGALNTGTHGGDFDRPPIADSVLAIHLVADGGKQYWIEPEMTPTLTDDSSLTQALSDLGVPMGAADFEIVRDSKLFNAVLVSAGRFGVIYS